MSTMIQFYRNQAERLLEQRSTIFEKRKTAQGQGKSDVCRVYDEQMENLATEAREAVQEAERLSEVAGIHRNAGALGNATPGGNENESAWRGLLPSGSEYRALSTDSASGGAAVPENTAGQYVDILRGKTAFLAGLPAENILRFTGGSWVIPQIGSSDAPALVGEGAPIPEGETILEGMTFKPKKYAAMRYVTEEFQDDSSVDARNLVANDMLRSVATEVDDDAFNGDGVATPINGIVSQGVSTPAAVSGMPTLDDIADAVQRIEDAGGEATVVWLAPDANNSIRKQREGTDGAYLGGSAADEARNTAWNLPRKVSRNVPSGTVVVADGTRVFVGWRQDPRVAYSAHHRFDEDIVSVRMTARVAGVKVAEADSVQVLTVTV